MPHSRVNKRAKVQKKAENKREIQRTKREPFSAYSRSPNWKGVFFLMLIAFNAVAGLTTRISNREKSGSDQRLLGHGRNKNVKEDNKPKTHGTDVLSNNATSAKLPNLCMNPGLSISNNPNIQMDLGPLPPIPESQGQDLIFGKKPVLLPSECVSQPKGKSCHENLPLYFKFTQQHPKRKKERQEFHAIHFKDFYEAFLKECKLERPIPFQALQDKLDCVKEAAQLLHRGEGACGQFASLSALRILATEQRHAPSMSYVFLQTDKLLSLSDTRTAHRFLVLNSGLPSGTIVGKEAVNKALKEMEGIICDSWNKDSFSSVAENQLKMYKPNQAWVELTVKNLNWHYDISHLSADAQESFRHINTLINQSILKLMKIFNVDLQAEYSPWNKIPHCRA